MRAEPPPPPSLPRLPALAAAPGGAFLIVAETLRRWHQFRDPALWTAIVDDYLIGGFLLFAAWRCVRRSPNAHPILAAAWGFAVGMGYPSVFGHAAGLHRPDPSGVNPVVLFGVILGLWLVAIAMLLLTLRAACRAPRIT